MKWLTPIGQTDVGEHYTFSLRELAFLALEGAIEDAGGLRPDILFIANKWPAMKQRFAELFRQKTRAEWCAIMEGTDICFAPVLTMTEAMKHPHMTARRTFVEFEGAPQAAPAPRFSRSECRIQGPPPGPGQHSGALLGDYGFSAAETPDLRAKQAVS